MGTCSWDSKAKVWNLNWNLLRAYTDHTSAVYDIEFIDVDLVATGSSDQTIKMWLISTGVTSMTINVGTPIRSIKLLSNGIHMACGTTNGPIYVYNVNTGGLIYNLIGHTTNVFDFVQIEFDFLASSSQDNTIRLWNLTTQTSKFILSGHSQGATGLKLISPNQLTSGSFDTTLKLWDITSGQLIKTFTGHSNQVIWSVILLNDGLTLVSGSLDQTVKLWNISTGLCLRTITTGVTIRAMALIKNITFIKSSVLFLTVYLYNKCYCKLV